MTLAKAKQKLSGRAVYALNLPDSQVYWTCPSRGCQEVHFFTFIFPAPGTIPIYEKECDLCNASYIAEQIKVSSTIVMLIVTFNNEGRN